MYQLLLLLSHDKIPDKKPLKEGRVCLSHSWWVQPTMREGMCRVQEAVVHTVPAVRKQGAMTAGAHSGHFLTDMTRHLEGV